ncbi:MAG: ABC transporter ATP-binding protein [Candidatus Dormibacteraeota bacterium]|nr:ABC transporter ATP-binding protein [Candidatus Dormibacteraeota bacterium]
MAVEAVSHSYGQTAVLAGVDLEVAASERVAIMGPSGAGKSTLLALIGGLDLIQAGSIRVGGRPLEGLRGRALAEHRRRTVGFVFQNSGLLDGLTAAENVELAMALAGVPRAERRRRAFELLDRVRLGRRATHRPGELSGGERQRVAIARSLANGPLLVLADEPTGNLDEDTADQVLDLLDEVHAGSGCTFVVVTHNPDVARRADRRVRLSRGRLAPLL